MKKTIQNNLLRCAQIILFLPITFASVFMLQAQTSNPVGAIPGAIDVSHMGAVTYTIPIEVVPGTQGMQPNLSVVYNSMSGMGLLGMKWSLVGLSTITRCGQTPYYDDGNITAIRFNEQDRFAIDGDRLVRINAGIYGAVNGEYATEVENFTRVVSYGGTTGHPAYFKAYTDDGSIIEYGNTPNSRQAVANGNVLGWYVNKIIDANNNYMDFEYEGSGGELRIKWIYYTKNDYANTIPQHYAKVGFTYIDIPDDLGKNTYFVGGYGISQTKLLKTVTIYYDNTTVRRYEFEYNLNDPGERTAHLKEVILYGEDGSEQLNATTVLWGEQNNSLEDEVILSNLPHGHIITGDFNGDGYTDYIVYGLNAQNRWRLYTGSATGIFENTGIEGAHKSLNTGEKACFFYKVDVTGDGSDELIIFEQGDDLTSYEVRILSLKNGVVQIASKTINNFVRVFFGDFDGDGRTDMLFLVKERGDNGYSFRYYIQSQFRRAGRGVFPRMNDLPRVRIVDFDGNGKADIELVIDNTFMFYSYDIASNDFFCRAISNSFPFFQSFSGDFNGDGITDILTLTTNSGSPDTWEIRFGKGDGTYTDTTHIPSLQIFYDVPRVYNDRIIIADFNGDGKDDIIQLHKDGSMTILYSTGCINGKYKYRPDNYSIGQSPLELKSFNIADMNNDGILDIVYRRNRMDNSPKVVYLHQNIHSEFVKEIKDGMGKEIHLDYKYKYYLAESSFYSSAYPGRQKKYFLSVVNSIKVPNGINNGWNTLQYQYDAPVFSLPRKIFLGFERFNCIDNRENKINTHEFEVDYLKKILVPAKQISYYGYEKISERRYSVGLESLPHHRFALNYSIIKNYDMLSNIATVTENILDGHGRLEKTVVSTYDDFLISDTQYLIPDTWIHSRTNLYSYETITLNGNRKKTVPTNVHTIQEYGDSPELVSNIFYEYYTDTENNGRLKSVHEENIHGLITTSYEKYTPTGLYREKTVSAKECEPRTEKYEYDDTYRFLTQVTNPIGHKATFTYDPKTGNKLSETNANSLTTTYSYDSFGNLTQVNYPDGTQTGISVDWYSSSFLPNARYTTYTTTTGKAPLRIYYDILGREVCRREDNNYFETRYNDRGQVERTSYPFGAFIDPRIWHEYEYDYLGRKIQEEAPYTSLSYDYDGRKVTVTDNLRQVSSSKTYDALGRIVQAEDAGGVINYSYTVTGSDDDIMHQTTITTNGSTTTILSDLWGNRRSITEPNAGEIVSSYNHFNELIEQTDANGNTTTYLYDRLGRVIRKEFIDPDENGQTIAYDYDAGSNAKGKLTAIYMGRDMDISGKVQVERFTYDDLSRLEMYSKVIGNNSYAFHYTYTGNGQLETLTYPSGFSVGYSYTSSGKLHEIRRSIDNSLIYRVNTRHNVYHVPTRCEYGNGIVTEYTYDTHGLLTRIKTGNKVPVVIGGGGGVHSGGILPEGLANFDDNPNSTNSPITEPAYTVDSAFLNYRYAYNDRGLIVSRSESVLKRLEKYEYDNLDRLTKITSGNMAQPGTPQIFSYSNSGNIEANSSLGSYVYDPNDKPHAVRSIDVYGNAISTNECNVVYNFFNQPTQITEGDYQINLFYGANRQRQKMEWYNQENIERTRYYINKHYEQEDDHITNTTRDFHYIYGDNGVVALHITTYTTPGGGIIIGTPKAPRPVDNTHYIHTDHLGSYCVITDAGKKVVQRNYFDPWGNPRYVGAFTNSGGSNSTNGLPPDDPIVEAPSLNFTLSNRGFTGHEHYPDLRIINMNGRLYDPVIARFFSPDKYVANSSFTQDFNRYTYARNNPLLYTDPSGELIWIPIVIGAFIGAMINVAVNADNITSAGSFFAYAGIGALAGGLAGAAGFAAAGAISVTGFIGGMGAGAAAGVTGGFITGAGNTWMQGGSFGQGLFNGLKSGVIGGVIGGVTGGLIGGINAAMNGANFWDGSFSQNFAISGTSDLTYQQALENAKIYNEHFADAGDIALADRMNSEFGYKAGTLDNGTLTTKPPSDYGLTQSQYYMKPDGTLSAGNFRGILGKPSTYQMHISPNVTFGNIVDFRAIAGHEIIHAFHAGAFGLSRNATWSEAAANRYSYNVYMNAGMHKPNLYNRLGYFPRSYLTPLHLFW